MTFWRRAPRSVYRVYDEDQYLAGEPEHVGEGEPAGEDREQTAAVSRGPRSVRLLALGLLAAVTTSAAAIVAVEVSRHSQTASAPPVARRDRAHPAGPAVPRPPMPASRRWLGPTATPMASAPAVPERAMRRSVTASLSSAVTRGRSAPYSSTAPTQPSVGAADMAVWHTGESLSAGGCSPIGEPPARDRSPARGGLLTTGESLSASELHTDGEFGFERRAR